jgi:Protein of unknown function (DUF2889)
VDTLLPPDPEGLDLLHTRDYAVQSWRIDERRILLRGAVRDTKPAGLYVPDDDQPMVIHHMVVDLTVDLPTSVIEAVDVKFEMHPHESCPKIVDHYDNLVGLSISRGYTHKIRELFGGPRGCSHTTALLQAMGPVATQSTWSMRLRNGAIRASAGEAPAMTVQERIAAVMRQNLNTCHVWHEDGEHVSLIKAGAGGDVPVWIRKRYEELGRDVNDWMRIARG